MAKRIEEVMTKRVTCVGKDASLREVAKLMRDQKIGDVLVTDDDGALCGIVTDRDVVVRAVAEGMDVDQLHAVDVCTEALVTIEPSASLEEAVHLMREKAIRRVPVCRDAKPVGIVSIGDLAIANDPRSALAEISASAPNN